MQMRWSKALVALVMVVLVVVLGVVVRPQLQYTKKTTFVRPSMSLQQAIQDGRPMEDLRGLIEDDPASLRIRVQGWLPLHVAVARKNHEVAALLLASGAIADINERIHMDMDGVVGETALSIAVNADDIAMARLLLDAGADSKVKNRWGETMLQFAQRSRNREMVELLAEHGSVK